MKDTRLFFSCRAWFQLTSGSGGWLLIANRLFGVLLLYDLGCNHTFWPPSVLGRETFQLSWAMENGARASRGVNMPLMFTTMRACQADSGPPTATLLRWLAFDCKSSFWSSTTLRFGLQSYFLATVSPRTRDLSVELGDGKWC